MKILMIVDDLNIGGTGTHVLSISKQLLKHKIDVLVVSSYGELHNKFNENNIDVIYIDFSKDLYKLSFEIIDIIKENKID
ncbi:MAG: glycosyltransferase, partial [Romboutsia sp.]|uniref:glycosyltransferase n=1 Tax=Romboutsia sp. TaxID=1965302 RepID=UPI003F3C406B